MMLTNLVGIIATFVYSNGILEALLENCDDAPYNACCKYQKKKKKKRWGHKCSQLTGIFSTVRLLKK